VGVEKVHFPQNSQNLGEGKCLGKPRKSFVGLPIAKFFRAFSGDGVFQHPQAFTLFENYRRIASHPHPAPRIAARAGGPFSNAFAIAP
jgi:hypothetical protein